MRDRLIEFLKAENKSSAQLAEEIGVQPSGISHILSGRNNPSLDFILKMLEKYPFISTDWLLFGTGTMYKDQKMRSLFDPEPQTEKIISADIQLKDGQSELKFDTVVTEDPVKTTPGALKTAGVRRIVWFYNDNSFEEYFPK